MDNQIFNHHWNNCIYRYQISFTIAINNLGLIYDTVKNDREQALDHYNKYLYIDPDADDAPKVNERIRALGAEQKIWGEPGAKGIGDKESLGRW